ncbi:MAG TPA: hypothetical protein VG871_07775 [Vicinamibacterales bacterium]|nr:hypothetical protein [Vicinamibacterales bacterium]
MRSGASLMGTNHRAAQNVKAQPPKRRIRLHDLSPNRHLALFRALDKLLADHGILGKVSALQVDDGLSDSSTCLAGQTRQVVLRTEPDGTIECSEECV